MALVKIRGLRKSGKSWKNMLGSFKPTSHTAYFVCRTDGCKKIVPLQIIKPNGLMSRVGACPFCQRRRPLTIEEQELITGNEQTGQRGMLGIVYKFAFSFAAKYLIDIDDATGFAFDAACTAASTFDKGNGFKFSTHLCIHLKGALNSILAAKSGRMGGGRISLISEIDRFRNRAYDEPEFATSDKDHREEISERELIGLALEKSGLSSRQLDVINCRFGLDGQAPMTLKQVGRHKNVSNERIRQIEISALFRMRLYLVSHDVA